MARHFLAWIAVLLAIGGTAGGLAYYKYAEISAAIAAAEASPEPREAVEAVRVRRGEWAASTRAVGTVVALRQVELRNELAGTVVEMGFASGDIVEAGQVLVRLDTSEERAALAAAQAEARLAQLVFDRRDRLRSSDAVSALDLDRAREELAAASARVTSLEAGIAKKTLVAPFRARVGLTDLQPGAYLDEGTRIAMLQGVDADAYVDFALPQDMAAAIRPGVLVSLRSPQIPGCQSASNFDPYLEWAPGAGQVGPLELTGVPGLQRMKAHGETPIPQRCVQASGRRGVPRWREPAWPGQAP
jgi:membrane fusion protein, multidrug efflux system